MVYKLPHPEAAPPKLDPSNIPPQFHHLIPLAEKYGIADDGYRIDVLENLDTDERNELIQFMDEYENAVLDWLAGPEAESNSPTIEYVTFAALMMAADYAQ